MRAGGLRYPAALAAVLGALALQAVPALASANAVTVTIQSPTAGSTVSGSITVSGTAGSKFTLKSVTVAIDAGASQAATVQGTSWTFPLNTNSLANGSHTLTARATDSRGNAGTASRSFTVNNPPPTIAITSPQAGATVSGVVPVSGAASSASGLASVQVELDSNAWLAATGTSSWSASVDTSAIASGTHTISARATDAYGRASTTSVSITVNNPPTITITSPAAGSTVAGTVTVTGTAGGPASLNDVTVQVDNFGSVVATGTSAWSAPIDTTAYATGSHTITARVYDSLGRSSSASVAVTFAAPPPPFTTNQSPWFLPDSTGGVSTVNETMTWQGSSQQSSPLPTGTITVQVNSTVGPGDTADSCVQDGSTGYWSCTHTLAQADFQFVQNAGGWSLHYAFQLGAEYPQAATFTVSYSGDSEFQASSATARMT